MRRRGFMPGSPPPILAAMVISRPNLAKIFPRLASIAPLKCLTLAHLLCPDMVYVKSLNSYIVEWSNRLLSGATI
jgi:hypothetical protein